MSVVAAWIKIIDEKGRFVGVRKYPAEPEQVLTYLRRVTPIAHPSATARREVLHSSGGYRAQFFLAEDYELWSRLAANGHRLANLGETLLNYRIHGAASKARRTKECLRKTLEVKRLYHMRHFSVADWMRYGGEMILLCLPASWIYRLFVLLTYERKRSSWRGSPSYSKVRTVTPRML